VGDAPRHDLLQGERTLDPLDRAKLKYLDADCFFRTIQLEDRRRGADDGTVGPLPQRSHPDARGLLRI